MTSITNTTTVPPYYDSFVSYMKPDHNTFYVYKITVLDLRKKDTTDHDRIKWQISGTIEMTPDKSLRDAIFLKHIVFLSSIENISDMVIDVHVEKSWKISESA